MRWTGRGGNTAANVWEGWYERRRMVERRSGVCVCDDVGCCTEGEVDGGFRDVGWRCGLVVEPDGRPGGSGGSGGGEVARSRAVKEVRGEVEKWNGRCTQVAIANACWYSGWGVGRAKKVVERKVGEVQSNG